MSERKFITQMAACAIAVLALLTADSAMAQRTIAQPKLEGMTNPGRIPGRFIVILNRDMLPSIAANPVLKDLDQVRSRTKEVQEAQAAVRIDIDRTTEMLTRRYGGAVARKLGPSTPGFVINCSDEVAKALAADPSVRSVIAEQRLQNVTTAVQSPAPSWGLDRIDQIPIALSNSYQYFRTGEGVHAYILDSGIRVTHQDFSGRATNDVDFVSSSGPGYCTSVPAGPAASHGTQVASVLGGSTYGVAKAVRLHSVRIVDCNNTTTTTRVIEGLDWIIQHSDSPGVVNISLRWLNGARFNASYSSFVETTSFQLYDIGAGLGLSLVIAAGNGGNNDDPYYSWPSGFQSSFSSGESFLVAATAYQSDQIWSGSSVGPYVDMFAPGENIKSASSTSNTATMIDNGTSLAAPHVSGVVALSLDGHPNAVPGAVHTYLWDAAQQNVVTGNLHSANNFLLNSLVDGNTSDQEPPPDDPPITPLTPSQIVPIILNVIIS